MRSHLTIRARYDALKKQQITSVKRELRTRHYIVALEQILATGKITSSTITHLKKSARNLPQIAPHIIR